MVSYGTHEKPYPRFILPNGLPENREAAPGRQLDMRSEMGWRAKKFDSVCKSGKRAGG
jgi:hypothetical protein